MGIALVALLAGALQAASDNGARAPLVVRLGVDLVRIDVVVTGSRGLPVTDLTAADFEVFQDGRRQTVTQVVYVGAVVAARASSTGASTAGALPPEEASEAIVFVVDDLALSPSSVAATSRALLRLADGMDSAMSVFLLRTGSRAVELRPVTGPAELRAMALALRPSPIAIGVFQEPNGLPATPFDQQAYATSHYFSRLLARQSLLSLQDITEALRGWKGRKAVVLFSEGFPVRDRIREQAPQGEAPLDRVYGEGEEVLDTVDRLTDLANRASVVIHTIDPRGLVPAGISASDSVPNPSPDIISGVLQTRHRTLHASQANLSHLAEQTGGITVTNTNDVDAGVARILSGSRGYYLVGYEPERATFSDRPRFHDIEVKVKRRGVKVRSRKGFFGMTDEAVAALAPPQSF